MEIVRHLLRYNESAAEDRGRAEWVALNDHGIIHCFFLS